MPDANLPILDLDTALLRFGGEWNILLRAAQTFAQAYAETPAECAALIQAGDYAALAATAHRVKGAATLFGAMRVGASAESLEQCPVTAPDAYRQVLALGFIADLSAAIGAISTLLPHPLPPIAPAGCDAAQRETAIEQVQRLVPLLRDADYAAAGLLDQLSASFAGGALADTVAKIRHHFDDLDTDEAARLAEQLWLELAFPPA